MLIFFVSTLGFVPFSFTVINNQFRIQVTSLLILTSVNFRWIVTQRLPTVSYLTMLDIYAIGALIFLVSLCGWHAIIGSDLLSGDKDKIDLIVLIVIGVVYVIYHVIYFTLFISKYRRYNKIGKKAEYEEFQGNSIDISTSQSINSVNSQTPSYIGIFKRKNVTLVTPSAIEIENSNKEETNNNCDLSIKMKQDSEYNGAHG